MWICKDQLGRRNLADAQKTAQDRVRKSSFQNGNLKTAQTSELVAKEHRMGKGSVLRAAKFSKGVDAAEKIESGAREAILSGKSKVPKSVIAELPEMEPEE